jgi:acetyl/propionyl-CoA carboxylase alpha subunit/acetyl-CoA carboxylase carboxyltransferase component
VITKLLIANRGEVAVRVARTAAEMGIATVAVYSEDDAAALHTRVADDARPLAGRGPRAYLDGDQLLSIARDTACDALHPGYGFLSENAAFARECAAAGVIFVGPEPRTLDLFGDKAEARGVARRADVPVLPGTAGPVDAAAAEAFRTALATDTAVVVKAVAGGGGRGLRVVGVGEPLAPAIERCASEADAAFGDGRVYVEQFLEGARHVEVQLAGDGDVVVHLWHRECSLQRHRQKLIETAPALGLAPSVGDELLAAAVRLARASGLCSLATIEFLVRGDDFFFIEANPRLQVEHTVTEAVTGLDLVSLQLAVAGGARLHTLALAPDTVPAPRGVALEARVHLETIAADGTPKPSAGTISVFEPPSGPGVRVDTFGYAGYEVTTGFDPLLAKVVVHSSSGGWAGAVAKAYRALSEFRVEGVETNISFLQSLLRHPEVVAGNVDTAFVESHIGELVADVVRAEHPKRYVSPPAVRGDDPLAVLVYGKRGGRRTAALDGDGAGTVRAPMHGTVISVGVTAGEAVTAGDELVVIEAMKMEHVVAAPVGGVVSAVAVLPGAMVAEGDALVVIEPADAGAAAEDAADSVDLDHIRPDLANVIDRHRRVLDDARPDAVDRRRRTGQRTARENIDDLCDPGTFTEYGPLTVAGRRGRNTMEELIAQTPADGLVMGLAQINGDRFPSERCRAAVLAYDYTVLAGTQGARNHVKLDRMAELALRWRLPTVFFTEGGGGRPGDTEGGGGFTRGFEYWGQLSGAVPLVGITSGRCFAGNAAILGCCDVIIATRDSALGMGGPAMVEGGGLGVFTPEEIGPLDVMLANGTIDVLVDDEVAAVAAAKRYLGYFQGSLQHWSCADQRLLRSAVPENRVRAYDMRTLIELLADDDSVLELRPHFGRAMITALIRIEGRPLGLIANNPQHLGGAIDADASDKAARFMQLCEAFDLPVLSLSDTPGNMVGPEAETYGLIRHCARMFVIGANLTVPIFSVIVRKSYGLGAIAMTGGSYQAAMFCVAWPTGEFGGMGLEGSVKLGYRNELAAIEDPDERKARFDEMVARAYAAGKALSRAAGPALDDVIDPADTRRWIVAGLRSLPPPSPRAEKKLPWIDAW